MGPPGLIGSILITYWAHGAVFFHARNYVITGMKEKRPISCFGVARWTVKGARWTLKGARWTQKGVSGLLFPDPFDPKES